MLSIRRQPSTTTKVTFAVIAFSIGLAGAAVFLSTNISKQNLERATEQSQAEKLPEADSQKEAATVSGATTDTEGSNKTSPFGTNTSSNNWWTQPSGSSAQPTTTGSTTPTPSTTTQSSSNPSTGGSGGGGTTQTPPPTQTCVILFGIKVCT